MPAVSALVTLLLVPLVSYFYPADSYGKISVFISAGAILMSMLPLGMDSSFIRFYYEPPRGMTSSQLATLALLTSLLALGVVSISLIAFYEAVGNVLFETPELAPILALVIYAAAVVLFRICNTEARMDERVVDYSVQQILQTLITKVSFLLIAWVTTDFAPSVIFITVLMALASLGAAWRSRKHIFEKPRLDQERLVTLLKFGLPCVLSGVVAQANPSVGRMVMGFVGRWSDAGIVSLGVSLASCFNLFSQAFQTFWAPYVYRNYKSEQATIKKMHDYILLASIVLVVLVLVGQDVLYLLVGSEYESSRPYFMLLMLSPVFGLIAETTNYGIILEMKSGVAALIAFGAVCANALVTFALAPFLGGLAAGIGTCVGSSFNLIMSSVIGARYYKMVANPKRSILVCGAIVCICASNTVLFNAFVLRLALGVAILFGTTIVYRAHISSVRKFVCDWVANRDIR
ncbi:lipopolysaccharide biosynthesis protein [Adlercreutzia sp. ZJ138]|uniref:lipopolysaccharide biosynthesis protein n=1 Tax=Adlercreutzia sp. ZJ138 TaxID=2709405 RepID=UPI0013EDCE54|nr:hypothetical protein [Adlercreutzia sp. ZJ138]